MLSRLFEMIADGKRSNWIVKFSLIKQDLVLLKSVLLNEILG